MAGFGEGLGSLIGGNMAANDLENAMAKNEGFGADFTNWNVTPYNTFGQSFLPTATEGINRVQGAADSTKGYDQFMAGYQNTPGAQYQLQQADQMQNNTAAAKGGLLSGSNLRALTGINNGIVSTNANAAYNEYLAGNNQQFGQLETALGNMFKAVGVGQTATGQQAGVTTAQMNSNSYLAAQQAKNDQGKGSGFGSLFSGLGSAFSF